jgi:hypothetical protein
MPSDFTRGYDGGVADAQTALRLHAAAGGPDSAPIFFSIDEDIDVKTWKSVAAEWLRGINLYWAWSAPVSMDTPGMCVDHRRWRSRALNHSRTPVGMANESVVAWKARTRPVLYQSVIVTASDPGVSLGGTHVDENELLAADFGQGVWRDGSRLPESP